MPADTPSPSDWRDDPRFKVRTTSRGYVVFPVYYRMIPELDPDRLGAEWYARERMRVPSAKNWRQEMELDFGAAAGGLVYPKFDIRRHVLLFPVQPGKNWLYGLAIDPGVKVTAALFGAIDPQGRRYIIDEYYEGDEAGSHEAVNASEHAKAISRKAQKITDWAFGMDDEGKSNKSWDDVFAIKLIDPSAWRRQGATLDLQSDALRYIDAGIDVEAASNSISGGIDIVRELEEPSLSNSHPNPGVNDFADPPIGWPLKWVYPGLKNYIKEKRPYRFQKLSDKPEEKQPDHIMDCERYLMAAFRDVPVIREVPRRKTRMDIAFERTRLSKNDRINPWKRSK